MRDNTRNKFSDLHNHLFEQLERLNDEDLKGEELAQEIRRAGAMGQLASQIISNGNLMMNSLKTFQPKDGKESSRTRELLTN